MDAERFLDFYASKGWMIGKNKMSDWKAAVRNWEKQDAERMTGSGLSQGASAQRSGNVFLDIAKEEGLF